MARVRILSLKYFILFQGCWMATISVVLSLEPSVDLES